MKKKCLSGSLRELQKEKNLKKIPINRNVEDVLKSIPRYKNHDFVFTYHGNPITRRDGLKKSFINKRVKGDRQIIIY